MKFTPACCQYSYLRCGIHTMKQHEKHRKLCLTMRTFSIVVAILNVAVFKQTSTLKNKKMFYPLLSK